MLLLLMWGCENAAPDEEATTADPCTPALVARVDRRLGVLPLPVHLSATGDCLEAGVPVWTLPDGAVVEGWEVDHTFLASGAFEVQAQLGELQSTVDIEVLAPSCPEVEEAIQTGELQSDELDEASGLMVSPSGLLWTHNDSGDGPRLFAMTAQGEHRGTVTLDGAPEGDWEDSSLYVDPETGVVSLFAGDIGDNAASRDSIVVYRLEEPDPQGQDLLVWDWEKLELRYPGGPRNADTLMVDPVTGDLLVVADDGWLYRKSAPHQADTVVTMEAVAPLGVVAMGGDLSPLGDRLLLRTGDQAWMWLRDQALPLIENLAAEPCALPLPEETRGEALAVGADGAGFYTVSEELHEPVWYTPFVPVEQPCAGFEPSIVRSPDGEIPLTVSLAIDPLCVPDGIASVEWSFPDETLDGLEVERTWLGSGEYRVQALVTDTLGETRQASTLVTVYPASCPEPGPTEVWGTVTAPELKEVSGLAASVQHEGLIWTHNDSGDVGKLFALNSSGELLETVDLGLRSGDWEDLAMGWTDAGWTLFVGNVGDNAVARQDIRIYLVPEEDPLAFGEMTLTYTDGLAHNCESIAIDPQSGDLIVVTKDYDGDTQVFSKPPPHLDGDEVELTWLLDLDTGAAPFNGSPATTAMDISPLGDWIAVRTYTDVWLFPRDASAPLADAFTQPPCDGEAPSEKQGEALAFTPDGQGLLLLSEGEGQPLHYIPLR